MGSAGKRLLDEALKLPAEDRAELAVQLIQSLDDSGEEPNDVALAWDDEIARRIRELDEGRAATVSWTEVRRRLEEARKGR